MRVLIPDLDATIEVDPIELSLREGIELAENAAARESDQAQKAAQAARAEGLTKSLDEYLASTEPRMSVTIGYIKPARLSELRYRFAGAQEFAQRVGTDETQGTSVGHERWFEVAKKLDDVYRDLCKSGLRGWSVASPPWKTETEIVRGREVQVAHEWVVEAIEKMGWLRALAIKVLEYNTLDPETKKK